MLNITRCGAVRLRCPAAVPTYAHRWVKGDPHWWRWISHEGAISSPIGTKYALIVRGSGAIGMQRRLHQGIRVGLQREVGLHRLQRGNLIKHRVHLGQALVAWSGKFRRQTGTSLKVAARTPLWGMVSLVHTWIWQIRLHPLPCSCQQRFPGLGKVADCGKRLLQARGW